MNKNKEKVPKIRFPGFTEPWEQRKLGDVVSYIVDNRGKNPTYYCSEGIPVIDNFMIKNTLYPELGTATRFIDEELYQNFIRKYNEIDDILLTLVGNGIGNISLFPADKAVIIQNTLGLRTDENKRFLFFLLMSKNQEIVKLDRGMAQPSIRQDEILDISIKIPKMEEQEKIGTYFSNLDNLITLHQRKLNHLKDKKKGLLQKMFPKNGELVPELRFPEFTDPWEQRKLGDMCDEFKSGSSILAKDICEQGEYPVYGGNGLRGYTATYNHDGIYALIGRQGALCGNMNKVYGKAYFTEHAVAVKANKNNNTDFLFFLLDKMNLRQYSGQSAQPGLAVNKLIELITLVPNCSEQKLIGIFFNKLDNLITLHQRKLDHLKEQKKALLQQMFI
ncbi:MULTISPECIES: restriction endonuclease subunit S [Clostridium]|uniref:restriction endonuclease subunit S n=1 Tax=Clostridium TaxID=1485 RepID=UPI002103DC1E|nr:MULTISPECIES: restriction endonuclease subunit S [Clostridium]MCQ2027550.1 restriction endonuclease subunit S [Clostridium butyricum]MDU1230447.1 restriction endonuclease subunit S [Clostridium sp.]